jgi:hypothetical protein
MFSILPPQGTAFCFIATPQDGEGYRKCILPEAPFKQNLLASGHTENIRRNGKIKRRIGLSTQKRIVQAPCLLDSGF